MTTHRSSDSGEAPPTLAEEVEFIRQAFENGAHHIEDREDVRVLLKALDQATARAEEAEKKVSALSAQIKREEDIYLGWKAANHQARIQAERERDEAVRVACSQQDRWDDMLVRIDELQADRDRLAGELAESERIKANLWNMVAEKEANLTKAREAMTGIMKIAGVQFVNAKDGGDRCLWRTIHQLAANAQPPAAEGKAEPTMGSQPGLTPWNDKMDQLGARRSGPSTCLDGDAAEASAPKAGLEGR